MLKWQTENPRPLPWDDGPRDPYHIWISEIIMQQTRIEQGTPYYLKFISRYPNLQALASASLDEVLRLWQGLGYYTRARNLHKAAKLIIEEFKGVFPDSYDNLIKLPGVGTYTAAAIASFAYGLRYPVVDGNVKRFLSRFSGITTPMGEILHDQISSRANVLMKGVAPADFNQAIMNFGALVCKPKGALCDFCPVSKKCYAFKHKLVDAIPVRTKKNLNRIRYFHFCVIHYRGKILFQRREGKDIWQSLYTPPLWECNSARIPSLIQMHSFLDKLIGHHKLDWVESSSTEQQQLSHQTIRGRFHQIKLHTVPKKLSDSFVWLNHKTLNDYCKPKMIIRWFVEIQDKKSISGK